MAGAIASQSHQTIFSRGIVAGVVAYQSPQTIKSGLTDSTSYEGDRQSSGSNPLLLFRDLSPVVKQDRPKGSCGVGDEKLSSTPKTNHFCGKCCSSGCPKSKVTKAKASVVQIQSYNWGFGG